MRKRTLARVKPGKPPKMGEVEAKAKFRRIKPTLDLIQLQQSPNPDRVFHASIQNPYFTEVNGVGICAFRGHVGENPKDAHQILYIYDPSHESKSKEEFPPWKSSGGNIKYTSKFYRSLPEGSVKLRKTLAGMVRGALKVAAWATVGAAIGVAMFYVDKSLSFMGGEISGMSAEAARGSVMLGASVAAIVTSAASLACGIRNSFKNRIIKFIRDPANEKAVEALERM